MTTNSAKLKPCPMCGETPIIDGKSEDVRVRCEKCGTHAQSFSFDPDSDDEIEAAEADAIAAWNRRTAAQGEPSKVRTQEAGLCPYCRSVIPEHARHLPYIECRECGYGLPTQHRQG